MAKKKKPSDALRPKDPRIEKAVFLLMDEAFKMHRGQVMTFETIIALTGLEKEVAPWNSVIKKFKRLHEKTRGITLWSEVGVGYRLTSVEEQINECPQRRRRFAHRHLVKGLNHLKAARLSGDVVNLTQQTILEGRLRAMEQARARVSQANKIAAYFKTAVPADDPDSDPS